jgi:hypothetical protein
MVLRGQGHAREAVREMRRAEALFAGAEDRLRARRMIDGVNASASDSLRVQLEADSVASAKQQARRPGVGPSDLLVPSSADSLFTPARPDTR